MAKKRVFVITRGLEIDNDHQLVQFLVPGFNIIEQKKCLNTIKQSEIDQLEQTFRLKVSGYIQDWEQALASKDQAKKKMFADQQTLDACWLVNQAVDVTVQQVDLKARQQTAVELKQKAKKK